jgi:hypothetical protein
MVTVPAQIEEQITQIRIRSDEHDQNRLGQEHGDHVNARLVLEHGGDELAALGGACETARGREERGDTGSQGIAVQTGGDVTVDQQSIRAQKHGGIDAVALPNCRDEIPNAGHFNSTGEVVAKLWFEIAEVKPWQSLEQSVRPSYSSLPSPIA